MEVIFFILLLHHSSISGGGGKAERKRDCFSPRAKSYLKLFVILICDTAPVAAVAGLLVPLETSHGIEKQKMLCSQQKYQIFGSVCLSQ